MICCWRYPFYGHAGYASQMTSCCGLLCTSVVPRYLLAGVRPAVLPGMPPAPAAAAPPSAPAAPPIAPIMPDMLSCSCAVSPWNEGSLAICSAICLMEGSCKSGKECMESLQEGDWAVMRRASKQRVKEAGSASRNRFQDAVKSKVHWACMAGSCKH